MQNTFSQSGNDSKWFSKKSFFRIGMWNSRPPPFMANTILNFHFDYWNTSLSCSNRLQFELMMFAINFAITVMRLYLFRDWSSPL